MPSIINWAMASSPEPTIIREYVSQHLIVSSHGTSGVRRRKPQRGGASSENGLTMQVSLSNASLAGVAVVMEVPSSPQDTRTQSGTQHLGSLRSTQETEWIHSPVGLFSKTGIRCATSGV
ncbi:hypothetical protein TcG_03191 [Trypanosoma cruzi]|nr:hypothetical protein TcG_03191 [Trypanosoma cruzi]